MQTDLAGALMDASDPNGGGGYGGDYGPPVRDDWMRPDTSPPVRDDWAWSVANPPDLSPPEAPSDTAPAIARFIPAAAAWAADREREADEFAAGARAQIADKWAAVHEAALSGLVMASPMVQQMGEILRPSPEMLNDLLRRPGRRGPEDDTPWRRPYSPDLNPLPDNSPTEPPGSPGTPGGVPPVSEPTDPLDYWLSPLRQAGRQVERTVNPTAYAQELPTPVEQGNIDLQNRPRVTNPDGSISTLRSMSFQDDHGLEVLIPTVSPDGRIMTDNEAIDRYYNTGEHLGKFSSVDAANRYAEELHRQQERMLWNDRPTPTAAVPGGALGPTEMRAIDDPIRWRIEHSGPAELNAPLPGQEFFEHPSQYLMPGPAGKAKSVAEAVEGVPGLAERAGGVLQDLRSSAGRAAEWTGEQLNRILEPAKNTAVPVREALADLANERMQNLADGQNWTINLDKALGKPGQGLNTAEAYSRLERTGQFAENPTPEQQVLAQEWAAYTKRTGDAARELGVIEGDVTRIPEVETYVPHRYEEFTPGAEAITSPGGRGLSPKGYYSNERTFPTIEEAQAAGLTPANDAGGLFGAHATAVQNSISNATFLERMKAADEVSPLKPGALPDEGNRDLGAISRQFQGYQASKDVADALSNILRPSALRDAPILGGLMQGMGVAKENLFSLSGFHLATELRQAYRAGGIEGIGNAGEALWNFVSPARYETFRDTNQALYSKWARNGVTFLTGGIERGPDVEAGNLLPSLALRAGVSGGTSAALGYTTAERAGASDEDALKAGLLSGGAGAVLGSTLGPQFTRALWERAVPTLKVLTAETLDQAGKGQMSRQDIGTFVNNTFGGQNLAAIARSPTVQDAIRLTTLAPDWWESWARQIGSAVQPGTVGDLSRAYWLRTAIVDGAFGLEGLNYALNGHFTNENEPGRQFQLETTGLYDKAGLPHPEGRTYADVLGPIKAILQLGATRNPGDFASPRMGLLPQSALAAIENKDYAGREITQPGTPPLASVARNVEETAARVGPIGIQQFNLPGKALGEQAFSTLTGMRTATGPDIHLQNEQRDEQLYGIRQANSSTYRDFERAGFKWEPPPRYVDEVPLTPDEQVQYERERIAAIQSLFSRRPDIVERIQAADPATRRDMLRDVDESARSAAEGKTFATMGNAEAKSRRDADRARVNRRYPTDWAHRQ